MAAPPRRAWVARVDTGLRDRLSSRSFSSFSSLAPISAQVWGREVFVRGWAGSGAEGEGVGRWWWRGGVDVRGGPLAGAAARPAAEEGRQARGARSAPAARTLSVCRACVWDMPDFLRASSCFDTNSSNLGAQFQCGNDYESRIPRLAHPSGAWPSGGGLSQPAGGAQRAAQRGGRRAPWRAAGPAERRASHPCFLSFPDPLPPAARTTSLGAPLPRLLPRGRGAPATEAPRVREAPDRMRIGAVCILEIDTRSPRLWRTDRLSANPTRF
jgi:hypothetical protein